MPSWSPSGVGATGISREPIGVAGEVTWRVPSLTLADQAFELFTDVPAGLSVDALGDGHQCPLID